MNLLSRFSCLVAFLLTAPAAMAAIISSVTPTTLTNGTILTLGGSGFGTNTADVALALQAASRLIPLRVLTTGAGTITAQVGPLPAGVSNAALLAVFGPGNRQGLVEPMHFGQPVFWESRGPATGLSLVTDSATDATLLTLIPTSIPAGGFPTNYLYTELPAGNSVTLTLPTNWPVNARLLIQGFLVGSEGPVRTDVTWTMPDIILPTGDSPSNALVTLASVLTNGASQLGLPLSARVTNFPAPASLAISVPGVDLDAGSVIVTSIPAEAGRVPPVITSISRTNGGYHDFILITGTNFGNNPLDLRVSVTGPGAFVPVEVLAATETSIFARLGFFGGPPFSGTLQVERGIGYHAGSSTNHVGIQYWGSVTNHAAAFEFSYTDTGTVNPPKSTGTVSFVNGGVSIQLPNPGTIALPTLMSIYLYPKYSGGSGCSFPTLNPLQSTIQPGAYIGPLCHPAVVGLQNQLTAAYANIGMVVTPAIMASGGVKMTLTAQASSACVITDVTGIVVFCPPGNSGDAVYLAVLPDCEVPIGAVSEPGGQMFQPLAAAPGDGAPILPQVLRATVVDGAFQPVYDDVVVSGTGPFYSATNRVVLGSPEFQVVPIVNPPGAITVAGTEFDGTVHLFITNHLPAMTQVRLTTHFEVTQHAPALLGAAFPLFLFTTPTDPEAIAARLRDALEDGMARNLAANLEGSLNSTNGGVRLSFRFPGGGITNGCIRVTFTPCEDDSLRMTRTGVGDLLALDWCQPLSRLQRTLDLHSPQDWQWVDDSPPYLFAPTDSAAFYRLCRPPGN